MGADIYLMSRYKQNEARYAPELEAVHARREQATSEVEREQLGAEIDSIYGKIEERSYFRDSYNASSLFWQLGLSWWKDIGPLLDANHDLPIEQARQLLDQIREREVPEDLGDAFDDVKDPAEREQWRQYFVDKRRRFIDLLETSIATGAKLHCSV